MNQYEALKIPAAYGRHIEVEQTHLSVTSAKDESIVIYASRFDNGLWAMGYSVIWADGRTSAKTPDPIDGVFRSDRDAFLYGVGFMIQYLEYFTPKTRDSLREALGRLIQTNLFI